MVLTLGKERTLSAFEHLRQPYESWSSVPRGTFRLTGNPLFWGAGPVGMDFDDRGVHPHDLDVDAYQLFLL